jgi:hypothetical protein
MYPQVVTLARLLASPYWADLALRDHIAARRPDGQRRARATDAVFEYRSKASGPPDYKLPDPLVPDHLLPEIAAGYLLEDGPGLCKFLADVRQTVEPRFQWSPYPLKLRIEDRDQMPDDPLVKLIHGRARGTAHRTHRARRLPRAQPGPPRRAESAFVDALAKAERWSLGPGPAKGIRRVVAARTCRPR